MEKLFKFDFLKQFKSFELFSDNACCFKNQYLMYYYYQLAQHPSIEEFKVHFLVENHGKSDCDQFFGTLSRWYKDFLHYSDDPLTCAKDLANFFNTKEPEKPKTPNNVIYSFENFVLEKYLLKEEKTLIRVNKISSYYSFNFNTESKKIQVKFVPSKAEFSKAFSVDDTQTIWPLKEDSTSYPNTNKDI